MTGSRATRDLQVMTLQLPSFLDVSSVERIGVGMSVAW